MFNPYAVSVVDRIIDGIVNSRNLRELDGILHSLPMEDREFSDAVTLKPNEILQERQVVVIADPSLRNLKFKGQCILNLATFVDAIKQQGNMDYLRGLIANQLSQFNEVDEMQCSRAILRLVDNINSFRDENSILLEFRRIGELLSNRGV